MKLNCGTWTRVTNFIVGETYGGCLEGLPNKKDNEKHIERLKTSFESLWGKRVTYTIIPKITKPKIPNKYSLGKFVERAYKDSEKLPKYYIQAWMTGPESDKKYHGAQVVLILFVEAIDKLTVPEMIISASKDFKWADIAENFYY